MIVLLTAFLTSLIVTALVIRYDHLHARYSADHDLQGVQKFHAAPVPRIGGLGVFLALVAAGIWLFLVRPDVGRLFLLLLVASLPAFLGGIIEDLTKRVGVLARLGLTMGASLLGFWLLNATLSRVDIPLVDDLLRYGVVALVFTAVAVGGVANAINIIDGFNGLAGMVSIMILGALGYVCYVLGDHLLWNVCLASIGGISGFFVWNYPRGLIFLGDGGAYLVGFLIGEVSVLLVARHPEVSPWFPMLLVIYPVFETLFSVYRRKFIQGASPGMPDALHMHTLIYKRLVRWVLGGVAARDLSARNSMTSPYLWLLCSLSVIPALLFWRSTPLLMLCTLGFAALYVWLYRRIVTFRSPRMLVRRQGRNEDGT
jgi:UDP-N-acetylmuramyl pentapeptide phosphotransferase/UDP-N-acetylglucosamine-1-phosphate transferase